jgi:hypothetical protein
MLMRGFIGSGAWSGNLNRVWRAAGKWPARQGSRENVRAAGAATAAAVTQAID